MRVFNMLVAYEVSCYGTVRVKADTFAEAVEIVSTHSEYFDACSPNFDSCSDYRIVEASIGERVIAEDVSVDVVTMRIGEAVSRMRELSERQHLSADELRAEAALLAERWAAYQLPDPSAISRADNLLEGEV